MILFRYSLLLFVFLLLAVSCREDEPSAKTGKLEFSFSADNASSGGRLKADASSLLVTIEDAEGVVIYERKHITLHAFGDEYLSEPIALTVGNFKLTEFLVLDEHENTVYASPVEGSPLDYLVDDPLPVGFSVMHDQTTKVSPEVIKIEGNTSADFGYATFGLNIVNTFTFATAVMAYNPDSKNFELTGAHVKVMSDGETLYDMELNASTNSIRVRDGHAHYVVTVLKDGYSTYEKTFDVEELKAYGTETPLVVTLLAGSLADGLIAYYPFNGNADDQSGNAFHGIVHGAVLTTDRHGETDAAYAFDGLNDYIQVPHDDALNVGSDFSISLWAKVSSLQEPEGGINDIIRKWTGNAEGYPFSISYLNPLADDANEDKILFARYDGQVCSNVLETHSPTVTNETFIHIALVVAGDNISTYLNSELAGEVTDPTTCSTANTADVTIGCRGNLVRFFKGKIDDIRIYNRALSEAEIGQLAGE